MGVLFWENAQSNEVIHNKQSSCFSPLAPVAGIISSAVVYLVETSFHLLYWYYHRYCRHYKTTRLIFLHALPSPLPSLLLTETKRSEQSYESVSNTDNVPLRGAKAGSWKYQALNAMRLSWKCQKFMCEMNSKAFKHSIGIWQLWLQFAVHVSGAEQRPNHNHTKLKGFLTNLELWPHSNPCELEILEVVIAAY